MDATTLNTIVGIIGSVVGIVGIVVGVIGWKSLSAATKIKKSAKADNGSAIQQAQVIHNGLDDYAVIRLSRETTQEELQKVIVALRPMTPQEIEEVLSEKIKPMTSEVDKLKEEVSSIPRIDIRTEDNNAGGTTLIIENKRFADEENIEKQLSEI